MRILNQSHITHLKEYYRLVDSQSFDALQELFSEDIVYARQGTPIIVGKKAFKTFYEKERIIASGKHTKLTFVLKNRSIHSHGCFSGVLKNGMSVRVYFNEIFYFDNQDKIKKRITRFPKGQEKI